MAEVEKSIFSFLSFIYRSSVSAPIMEEKLTRVHPHCLAIYAKDKRQKPFKDSHLRTSVVQPSICCIYDASRLLKADEVFAKVLKLS